MKDLMAPPTKEELSAVTPQAEAPSVDLMAPPSTEELKAVKANKLGPLESAISGLSQGLTFGYADEIIGGVRAGASKITGDDRPIGDIYREKRDEQRAHVDQAKVDNTKSFIGGSVVGALASPASKVLGPMKGASTLANIGRSAAGGAVAGAGLSNTDMTEPGKNAAEFAKDTAVGAALGGATQGIFSAIGGTVNALKPSVLRAFAAKKAVQAAGGMTKEMRDLGPERIQDLGSTLLKEKIVTAGASLEDIATKAAARKETAGQEIGKALDSVDDLVTTAKRLVDEGEFGNMPEAARTNLKEAIEKQFQFNMRRIGERIEKELIKPNMMKRADGSLGANPALTGEVDKLISVAENFKSFAPTTMRQGNVVKGAQGRATNFNSETIPQAFRQEVYHVIKSELDDVVAKTGNLEAGVAKALGQGQASAGAVSARNQGVSNAYQGAKKTYGQMTQAEDMALKSAGRNAANRTISLTDTIAGVGGMAAGGPVPALALGAANKLVRKYGDSLAAVGAMKTAEALEKTPAVFGKFASVLENAARNGTLPATHLELMKDPDYRRISENLEKSGAMQRRLQGSK